jgi:cellulose synthase (UDP-forming)
VAEVIESIRGSHARPEGRRRATGAPRRPAAPPIPDSVLPQPPTDVEKHLYVNRNIWVLTTFSVLGFASLLVSQIRMAELSPWFWAYMPFLAFTILYFLTSVVTSFTPGFDLEAHRRMVAAWQPAYHPTVDVLLPVCGEPIEVLRNTWTHVAAMAEHYQGFVTAYVLDDSDTPALRKMATEFGFVYAGRSNRGWYKKAGNLLYGYRVSRGDFILLLDADFAPRADLLDETLPYMEADPKLGIVQTPQYFRVLDHQSWLERGAGAVQELFYRSVQTSMSSFDGAICVGTCAVYRRAALDANGGMTLIEHSEDVHTGFDLYRAGWRLRYVPVALSTGVCPDNIPAYVNQQYRWCSGNMSMLGSGKFWKTRLPWRIRLSYLSGFFYYLHTALMTFFAPLIPIGLLLFLPQDMRFNNLAFVLPSLFYAGVIFPMWHRCPYRLEAWACRMIYGWAHVFTIYDVLRNNRMGWQPSGSSSKKQGRSRRFWIGMIGWTGGTAAIWLGLSFWRMMTMNPTDFLVLFVSALFYAVTAARVLVPPRAGAA